MFCHTPFFISHQERSGSEHLRFLLDSHPDINCKNEIFKPLDYSSPESRNTRTPDCKTPEQAISKLERLYTVKVKANGFKFKYKNQYKLYPEIYNYLLEIIPALADIFPNAKFIFSFRRGIETILSSQRKFLNLEQFELHCESWANSMRSWYIIRNYIMDNYIEISQREMSINPELTSERIADYLNMEGVDAEKIQESLTGNRHQQTQIVSDSRYISLEETGWSDEQKQTFIDVCGEMMEIFGFSLQGEDATDEPLFLFYDSLGNATKQENIKPGQYRLQKNGFTIRPNLPGNPPATITYHNILLRENTRFNSLIHFSPKKTAHTIYYGIKISKAGSNQVVVSEETSVTAGVRKNWEVNFKPLTGRYDVSISTRITDGQSVDPNFKTIWENSCFLRAV